MKCTECQKEILEGSVFCPVCGSAQFEETVFSHVQPEETEAAVPQPEQAEEARPDKKQLVPKLVKWLPFAACLVLAAVVILAVFALRRPGYAAYFGIDGLYLVSTSGDEPVKLADTTSMNLTITEDQKHIFYRKGRNSSSADLYHLDLRSRSGEPEKLAENVSQFYVNAKGSKAIYIQDGNLYVNNMKTEKLIGENVGKFYCDEDMDTLVYAQIPVLNGVPASQWVWYIKDGDAEPKMIGIGRADVAVLYLTADGKKLFFSLGDELYVRKDGKEVLIAKNASVVTTVHEDGCFYYKTENASGQWEYSYYDGKKSTEITGAQNVGTGSGAFPMLFWQEGSDGHSYVAIRDKILEIPLERVVSVELSEAGRTVCITAQDENEGYHVYAASVVLGKLAGMRQLVRGAEYVRAWFVGEKLYYWTGAWNEPGTLYFNGKAVLENVQSFVQIHQETGTLLVQGEESSDYRADVYTVRNGKATRMAENVSYPYFATNGDVVIKTENSELQCFGRGKKGKILTEDVVGIYFINEATRPGGLMHYSAFSSGSLS